MQTGGGGWSKKSIKFCRHHLRMAPNGKPCVKCCTTSNLEGREDGEIPAVTLRYYHTIPSREFFLNRSNYRYVIAKFFYEYCNPFYNLNSSSMYIGCI